MSIEADEDSRTFAEFCSDMDDVEGAEPPPKLRRHFSSVIAAEIMRVFEPDWRGDWDAASLQGSPRPPEYYARYNAVAELLQKVRHMHDQYMQFISDGKEAQSLLLINHFSGRTFESFSDAYWTFFNENDVE